MLLGDKDGGAFNTGPVARQAALIHIEAVGGRGRDAGGVRVTQTIRAANDPSEKIQRSTIDNRCIKKGVFGRPQRVSAADHGGLAGQHAIVGQGRATEVALADVADLDEGVARTAGSNRMRALPRRWDAGGLYQFPKG